MNRYLFPGDVFRVKEEMKVIAEIPMKYVFSNRLLSSELTEHVVEVGKALQFDSNLFKDVREVCIKNIRQEIFSSFGFEVPDITLVSAISGFLPTPRPDSYDTNYLCCDYVVDSVERNKIQIHNSDYGYEICVKAHKERDENQKIRFCQSGISEALILPKDIDLVKEGDVYLVST